MAFRLAFRSGLGGTSGGDGELSPDDLRLRSSGLRLIVRLVTCDGDGRGHGDGGGMEIGGGEPQYLEELAWGPAPEASVARIGREEDELWMDGVCI